jgi:hypothetical protein
MELEKNEIHKILAKFFGAEFCGQEFVLSPIKADSTCAWLLEVHPSVIKSLSQKKFKDTFEDKRHFQFFVKALRAGLDYQELISERSRATVMTRMHDLYAPATQQIRFILDPDGSPPTEQEAIAYIGGVLNDTFCPRTVIVEVQQYIRGTSLRTLLGMREDRRELLTDDEVLIEKVCRALRYIHNQIPIAKQMGLEQSAKAEELHEKLDDEYRLAIHNVFRRVLKHVPHTHTFVTKRNRVYLLRLIDSFNSTCKTPWLRTRALHGDLGLNNILLEDDFKTSSLSEDSQVKLIDFLPPVWGEPGLDIGWLVGDIYELALKTGKPYYRLFINRFLSKYIEMSRDREIRRTMLLGLLNILAIKLNPKSKFVVSDTEVLKRYLEDLIKIFKVGVFPRRI